MDKLLISVLGHSDSGKTTTWSNLFGATVKTGTKIRRLYLSQTEYVEVFLISGSPQERDMKIEDIIEEDARIVLCSTQYVKDVTDTFDYFFDRNFYVYVQWLNPSYHGSGEVYFDSLGLLSRLAYKGATVCIRNGKQPAESRVNEIKEYLYGWANFRGLVKIDTKPSHQQV